MLWRTGQISAAKSSLNHILLADPGHPEANNLIGIILLDEGEEELARNYFHRALERRPDYAAAHNNLGNIHFAHLELDRAASCYSAALKADPDYVEALTNLGPVFNLQGKHQAAEHSCRRAVDLSPEFAGAHCNLGNALLSLARVGEAVAEYHEALRLQPSLPEALANLALALEDSSYLIGTIDYYEKQIKRQPANYLPYLRIAQALQALHRWDDAHERLLQALEIQPKAPDVLMLLGINHAFIGEMLSGIGYLRRVIELNPNPTACSGIIFDSLYLDGFSGDVLCREYRYWAARYAVRPLLPMPPAAKAIPERKLRIGYVSHDFGRHPVAFFLEPILIHHNRSHFEVYCYSTRMRGDELTERFKKQADVWRDISQYSETKAGDLILNDQIDILVDLSGHTAGNRLGVFASRPAPVQVTYLGHPATTGLSTIDYRIGDSITDPRGLTESHYTEQLWRLPECFLTYRPSEDTPPIVSPPILSKGYVTFGSFNNVSKVNDTVIATWAEILTALPTARMMIKNYALASARGRARVTDAFLRHGISIDRLELIDWRPDMKNHLELYGEIDIALDPFPYNGTTTTCEALWMGVPVICLEGQRHSSRVGTSLLTAMGLTELLTSNGADYVHRAVELAGDTERLMSLRQEMRDRMQRSSLLDHQGFTLRLEAAYREMWRNYCTRRSTDSPTPPESQQMPSEEFSTVINFTGGKLCVPASLENFTRYVLEEQGDWYEDEIRFVRKMLKLGDKAIDVGANFGAYTVSIASLVGITGKVWAIEPAPTTVAMLKKTVSINDFNNVEIIECAISDQIGSCDLKLDDGAEYDRLVTKGDEAKLVVKVDISTLDELSKSLDWTAIDFVKIDAEGQETKIIRGGANFLTASSPLVMAEYRQGQQVNHSLIAEFASIGFRPYRLVSMLMVLAPFKEGTADSYLLNIFFCRDDRARILASRGLLVEQVPMCSVLIESMPSDTAINYYGRAKDPALPVGDRLRWLEEAASLAARYIDASQSLEDRIPFATILAGTDAREQACVAFNKILDELQKDAQLEVAPRLVPYLFEPMEISPENFRRRTIALIAEWLARNAWGSSFFQPIDTLRYLFIMREYGYHREEAERRIALIERRRAAMISPPPDG